MAAYRQIDAQLINYSTIKLTLLRYPETSNGSITYVQQNQNPYHPTAYPFLHFLLVGVWAFALNLNVRIVEGATNNLALAL